MTSQDENKKFYTKLWGKRRLIPHTFWSTWEKYKTLIPDKNPKLLEIGCGTRPKIPVKGSHFLDITESALEQLKQGGGICKVGDATTLPYDSDYFDFICASEILEHIPDDKMAISEIYRVMKKDGHFALSVPLYQKYWTRFDDLVEHVRRYDPKELSDKLEHSGFKIKWYYIGNKGSNKLFKNLAAFFLASAPKLGIFLEEKLYLPITEKFQKSRKSRWQTGNFLKDAKDASLVNVIVQK